MIQAITIVGWHWPQALIPGLVEHHERKMPVYILSVVLRWLSLTALVVLTFFLKRFSIPMGAILFMSIYAAYISSAGIAGIPFFDIVAKSVAPRRRGAFFGLRRVFGGILAALMGSLLYAILSRPQRFPFPHNYALIFLIACGLILIAVICFICVREPIHPVRSKRLGFRGFIRKGLRSLREDRAFRIMLLFRIAMALAMISLPFLTPCALEILGAEQSISGTYVTLWMITAIMANIVWAYVSDRHGTRLVFKYAAIFCVVTPTLALAAIYVHQIPEIGAHWSLLVMTAAVIAASLFNTAFMMGSINYLLEIAPGRSRPTYIGTCQLALLPTALFPLGAGVLASVLSYKAVFFVALVSGAPLFWLIRKLPEPRHTEIHLTK